MYCKGTVVCEGWGAATHQKGRATVAAAVGTDLTLCKSYLLNQEASCKSLSHNSLEIKEKDILQGLKKAIWRIGDVIQ